MYHRAAERRRKETIVRIALKLLERDVSDEPSFSEHRYIGMGIAMNNSVNLENIPRNPRDMNWELKLVTKMGVAKRMVKTTYDIAVVVDKLKNKLSPRMKLDIS